jgi:hypothetical protein
MLLRQHLLLLLVVVGLLLLLQVSIQVQHLPCECMVLLGVLVSL